LKQKSIKYPINKAKRLGVRIVRGTSSEDLQDFYRLNLLTRRRHGVIPQPFRFFENLFDMLQSKSHGCLSLAKYGGATIAASIFMFDKKTVYHKYNASSERFANLCPNHLIIWNAIEQAHAEGFEHLDLGRTAPDNHGLMAFKRHWGSREYGMPYYYWPEARGAASTSESSFKYRIASSIMKKSPVALSRFAGSLLYRHFG
jgi:lipid II:glycine glycyltransferase (peptidoglycan interpeptide bridge formation enzyme)